MASQGDIEDVLQALNHTQKLATRIKNAGYVMDKADLKQLLADMTASIATSKLELSLFKDVCSARDAELKRINEVLVYRGNLRRRGDGYYKTLETGRPYGQPYCSYCWENEQKMLHLHNKILSRSVRICPQCKNEYQAERTPFLEAPDDAQA